VATSQQGVVSPLTRESSDAGAALNIAGRLGRLSPTRGQRTIFVSTDIARLVREVSA
jgi:hypothetical protein